MLTIASENGFTPAELTKVTDGFDLANEVIASDAFKQGVLAHTKLDGSRGFENTDDTPEEVYAKLTSGDSSIAISVRSYSPLDVAKRHEVAHENPDGGVVFNRKFFSNEDLPSLVNTIVHEYCHTRGFTHDRDATARRPFSTPYGVGAIAQKVALQLLAPAPPHA